MTNTLARVIEFFYPLVSNDIANVLVLCCQLGVSGRSIVVKHNKHLTGVRNPVTSHLTESLVDARCVVMGQDEIWLPEYHRSFWSAKDLLNKCLWFHNLQIDFLNFTQEATFYINLVLCIIEGVNYSNETVAFIDDITGEEIDRDYISILEVNLIK